MKEKEGTLQARKNFILERDRGLSVADIAEKYGVSKTTIYNRVIPILAKELGVEPSTLLEQPHEKPVLSGAGGGKKAQFGIEKFEENSSAALNSMESYLRSIEEYLEGEGR